MSANDYEKVRKIFDAAEAIEGPEREAYLGHACSGDLELRRKVDELLAAQGRMGRFLEIPAAGWTGQKIGAFVVDDVIAEGGMGIVLKATQEHPRRSVAIKS
jgi:hypothetical protein